jgi:dipeptide transport system ATP-binding protein
MTEASPILEAKSVKQYYKVKRGLLSGAQDLKALDGVSFSLHAGKTLAVVGESGCGKSTLARLVTQIEEPTDGDLLLDGVSLTSASSAERRLVREKIQIVFQDPFGSLNPRHKISTILEEPLVINRNLSAPERRDAGMAMLVRVGLRPEHYDRYPHMFSGGQRQRIAIARALMLNPKVLVLDEPVSALDISIQAQVLNLLKELQQEFQLAYLFISHDLSVVRHVADEVMVIYLGRAVEHGPKNILFDDPKHPYSKALLSATPVPDPSAKRDKIKLTGELPSPLDPPPGCSFNPRCPLANDRCSAEPPVLALTKQKSQVACHAVEEGRD